MINFILVCDESISVTIPKKSYIYCILSACQGSGASGFGCLARNASISNDGSSTVGPNIALRYKYIIKNHAVYQLFRLSVI
jgi:hypothetical protein